MVLDLHKLAKYDATYEGWDLNIRESKSKAGKIKGLYFLFDNRAEVAYIGKSNDIRQRVAHHLFCGSKHRISKVYSEEICFFSFLAYLSDDIISTEKANILHYKPRMNSPFDRAYYGFSKCDFLKMEDYMRFQEVSPILYLSI